MAMLLRLSSVHILFRKTVIKKFPTANDVGPKFTSV